MRKVKVLQFLPVLIWIFGCKLNSIAAVDELKCEKITVSACQNLGYNMTVATNSTEGDFGGYKSQLDAEILITSLRQVIDSGCSKQARFLFCSSLFPLCSPNAPSPVKPCRSLCEQVKNDCFKDPIGSNQWPNYLECKVLPQSENQGLCMQMPGPIAETTTTTAALENETSTVKTWPAFKFSFPHGSIAPGTHPNQLNPSLPQPVIKPIQIAPLCPTNYTENYDHCVPKCGGTVDAMYTQKQKNAIEFLTLILSAVCFIFTLMSLVTFWTKSTKFDYPERPLFFMTLCYNLLGLCYLERIILHNPRKEILDLMVDKQECTITSQCLAYYIIKNYFLISATTWWLIFGICWYLSTVKQWSCEALEKKSGLFHVLAWVIPFTSPISALLRGNVKKFELTGFCSAKGFTEIPVLILLVAGATLLMLSLYALMKLKTIWNQGDTLSKVFVRVLVFGVTYFVPAVSAVICSFFEDLEPTTTLCAPNLPCETPNKSSMLPTFIKLILTLIGGSLTGIWIWSKKPCDLNKKAPNATPFKSVPLIRTKKYNYNQLYLPSSIVYTAGRVHRMRPVNTTTTITRI